MAKTWTLAEPLTITSPCQTLKLRPNGEAIVTTTSVDTCCGATSVAVFDFRLPGGLVGFQGLEALNNATLLELGRMAPDGATWAPEAD